MMTYPNAVPEPSTTSSSAPGARLTSVNVNPRLLSAASPSQLLCPHGEVSDPAAMAWAWAALTAGTQWVEGHFFAHGRIGLCLSSAAVRPLSARHQAILQRFLAADANKVVGFDEGVAASTVTALLQQTLRGLGIDCVPSRVPFLLVVAAAAARLGAPIPGVRRGEQTLGATTQSVLTLHDPSRWLAMRLTPSEARVALLRLEGLSYAEIAAHRGSASRTVANLLASGYRKLKIGGRSELMALLADEYRRGNVPLPRDGEVPALISAQP